MKYIAIFLFLINLTYFAWMSFGARELSFNNSGETRPLLNNGMVLLSEYQGQIAAQEGAAKVAGLTCLAITGFTGIEDARALANDAVQLGLITSVQVLEVPASPQYRVFLPPASSQAMATLNLDALTELATNSEIPLESYLITRGPLENAVALGVFSNLVEAREVQETLAKYDYAIEIEELNSTTEDIRVQLSAASSVTLGAEAWSRLAESWTELQATENVCETIAQGRQFP